MDRRRFLVMTGAGLAATVLSGEAAWASRGAIPSPTGALVTRWDRDRWSRGAYSALPVGVSPSVRRTIADTLVGGRIAFAGEYASTQYPATTTGAYLSGQHAASRLLERGGVRTAIVVGAGMAGASAAHQLVQAGLDVTVIEARERIGGRIHSSDTWGVPVELGAAWIHGVRGNPLVPLARADGLRLLPTDYNDAVARDTKTGRVSTTAEREWTRLENLVGRLEEAWPPRSTSATEWLEKKGWHPSRVHDWAAQVEITQDYGLDPGRLGVRAFEEGAAYRGGDSLVAGGYDSIPRTLLAGTQLRLAEPVTSVEARGTGVHVALASGRTLKADVAVVAVPLEILKQRVLRIVSTPAPVRSAIDALVTGDLEKVVLRYDEQWWGDHRVFGVVGGGATGAPTGSLAALRWTEFYSLTDVVGFPTLVGFSGGKSARKRPSRDSQCVKEATRALDAAFANLLA